MGRVKTTIPDISNGQFEELRNERVDLKFIWKRAQEHFTHLTQLNQKFAIVSIDMQPSFLKNIVNKFRKKVNILIEYHRELKRLCKLNNINFIEIEYENKEFNILREVNSIIFFKNKPHINDSNFFSFLKNNNIDSLFIIGVFRNACILESIAECYDYVDSIYTSLIGTGTSSAHLFAKEEFNQKQYSLETFIRVMRNLNVEILDYDESRLGWRL